jgi:hypothetical protein
MDTSIKDAQLAHCLFSSTHAIQRPNTVAAQIDSANHATTAPMIMVAVMLLSPELGERPD